jgi:hypothetical protein
MPRGYHDGMNRTLTTLALVAIAACGRTDGGASGDVIDREAFIATYVDLRVAAQHAPDLHVSDEQRAEILARHGVDEAGLLEFADVHGRDIAYMSEVWNEINTRIQEENRPGEPN